MRYIVYIGCPLRLGNRFLVGETVWDSRTSTRMCCFCPLASLSHSHANEVWRRGVGRASNAGTTDEPCGAVYFTGPVPRFRVWYERRCCVQQAAQGCAPQGAWGWKLLIHRLTYMSPFAPRGHCPLGGSCLWGSGTCGLPPVSIKSLCTGDFKVGFLPLGWRKPLATWILAAGLGGYAGRPGSDWFAGEWSLRGQLIRGITAFP